MNAKIRALQHRLKRATQHRQLALRQVPRNSTKYNLYHKKRIVGDVQLKAYDPSRNPKKSQKEPYWHKNESSYWLGINVKPKFRGKGYGTQGYKLATKLIPHGSGISAFIENTNTPSIRAAKRSGFRKTRYQESKRYSSHIYHKVRHIKSSK